MDHLIESMVQETFQNVQTYPPLGHHGLCYTLQKNGATIQLSLYPSAGRMPEGGHFFPLPYHDAYSVLFEQFHQQFFYFQGNYQNPGLDWWNLYAGPEDLIIEKNSQGNFLVGPLGDFAVACHFFSQVPGIFLEEGRIRIPKSHEKYVSFYDLLTKGTLFSYSGKKGLDLYFSERALIRLFWLEIIKKVSTLFQ